MRSFHLILVLVVAACVACTQRPPEQQIVLDAADALGGRDRILAAKAIVMEGQGSNANLGQDMTPEATGQSFEVTAFRRSVSLDPNRTRTEQTRTPKFAYFQGMAAQLKNFLDQTGPLWMKGALINKVATVMSSTATQTWAKPASRGRSRTRSPGGARYWKSSRRAPPGSSSRSSGARRPP